MRERRDWNCPRGRYFEYPTIAELAAVTGKSSAAHDEQDVVTGDVQLLPIQQWFFEQQHPSAHHWNMALLLETLEELNPSFVEEALGNLIEHHDALRLRFTMTRMRAGSNSSPLPVTPSIRVIDLSQATATEKKRTFEMAAAEAQASLNLNAARSFAL